MTISVMRCWPPLETRQRKTKTKNKEDTQCAEINRQEIGGEGHSEREKELWLLARSLPATSTLTKRVVKVYSARMWIEEAFRDIKSYRYGAFLELNLTLDKQRLQILMLIGMLVILILWLLGAVVIMSGEAKHCQANTGKKRRVLSVLFLGLRVSSDDRIAVSDEQLTIAYDKLISQMRGYGDGW